MKYFLRLNEVERMTTLRRSKIYQLIKEGEFPPQIKVSKNRSAWLQKEIQEWMSTRITASRT